VNFVTCHDGFTLRDLVSYDAKHNEANGESNKDGTDDNRSWNCGSEGPTDDPAVRDLRTKQSRALFATTMLSLGVPMLLGGDELGRTQQGNNNAYCQDNETSWFDWTSIDEEFLSFARQVVATRRRHPVLRRRRFVGGAGEGDVQWFTPVGSAMTDSDWNASWTRSVVMYADGKLDPDRDEQGRPILDDDLLLLINGWWEPLTFTLPDVGGPRTWKRELDTFDGIVGDGSGPPAAGAPGLGAGSGVTLGPRSLVLLKASRSA